MKQAEKLKILIVSSEASPFIKSGGLGDVAGSLPKALKELGADVRVVIPKYRKIKNEHYLFLFTKSNCVYARRRPLLLRMQKTTGGLLRKTDRRSV